MGLQRQDDDTVIDEDGNVYYMPLPRGGGTPAPSVEEAQAGMANQANDLVGDIDARQYMERMAGQTEQSAPPDQVVTPPPEWTPAITGATPEDQAAGQGFTPQLGPKPTVKQARDASIVGDITGFSSKGGVVSSREDMARGIGGVGQSKEAAAVADEAAKRSLVERQATRDKLLSQEAMRIASANQQAAERIDAEAKSRWELWKHEDEEARKAIVDPNRVFTNMSTGTRALWMIGFLGAGLQGNPASLKVVIDALDQEVSNDIASQKFGINNRRESIKDAAGRLKELDQLDKNALGETIKARNLRYEAIGKALDARIAQMGAPAAEAAGLLKAKAAIQEKVMEGQATMQKQIDEDAKAAKQHGYNMSLERLKASNSRSLKQMEIDAAKDARKEEKEGQTVPLNTNLGLHATNKVTGQAVGGSLRIKGGKEDAVKAGQILSGANIRYKMMNEVAKELEKMDTPDLIRGGSAKFKAKVKELAQRTAKELNGGRPTDKDFEIALMAEFGLEADGTLAGAYRAARSPGGEKANARAVINGHIRNLASETENAIAPYIMDEDAQSLDITFVPTMREVQEPSGGRTTDDVITAAAGGSDVGDLTSTPARPAKNEAQATKAKASAADTAIYLQEKKTGKLPKLTEDDERRVQEAIDEYQKRTPEDIKKIASAYDRNKGLSPEAKFRIAAEATIAATQARLVEDEITSKEEKTFKSAVKGQYPGTERLEKAWETYKQTPEYKERHKDALESAGLVEE